MKEFKMLDAKCPVLKEGDEAITHSGVFHADETLATAILELLFGNINVIRTRNPEIIQKGKFVFDVGLEYSYEKGCFDHHQGKPEEKEKRENGVPYAAAGLIWRHYGRALIAQTAKGALSEQEVEAVFVHIDETYVQGIDALDNGMRFEQEVKIQSVSQIVNRFNPIWDSEESEDDAFWQAVDFIKGDFSRALNAQLSIYRARNEVEKAYRGRKTKELLVIEKGCPWVQTLLDIDASKEVQFAVYPVESDGRKEWRVQVVPLNLGEFPARKDLPEAWAAKNGKELGQIVGVEDAIFCHAARFVCGAVSFESAIKMAELAVAEQ